MAWSKGQKLHVQDIFTWEEGDYFAFPDVKKPGSNTKICVLVCKVS